jgi:hypothetical protein
MKNTKSLFMVMMMTCFYLTGFAGTPKYANVNVMWVSSVPRVVIIADGKVEALKIENYKMDKDEGELDVFNTTQRALEKLGAQGYTIATSTTHSAGICYTLVKQ